MKSESNTFAQTGIRAQGIPSALTCQAKLKEIGQRGIYNLIRRLATTLMASLKQRSEPKPMHTRVQELIKKSQRDQKDDRNMQSMSYAAVTVLGIQPSGVEIALPTPLRALMHNMQETNRLRLPEPIQGTPRIILTHCLDTMLRKEGRSNMLSDDLINLISLARKPSTFKKHTGYFLAWVRHAQHHGAKILPISPMDFANFLISAAAHDNTASPTLSRCDAISFFCDISNTPSPMQHSLCRTIKEALKRRLGIRGRKKLPLLHEQISAIFTRQLTNSHTLHTLVTCFRMAIMYEGCLRWHDMAQISFGDIIITKTFLRIFIQQAKTDAYRKGQWVTVDASLDRFSTYSLLAQVLDTLAVLWIKATNDMRRSFLGMHDTEEAPKFLPISDIPLIFYIDKHSQAPYFNTCTDYPHFLNTLQEWAALEGLDRADVGTHSLRRGLASDWALVGIPDRLRRAQGRWRSEIVADGYIDESINIQMQLRACHHAARNHADRQQQRERVKKQNDRAREPHPRRQSQRKTKPSARIDL